ncbi:MAG TPA: oligopeptide:H+ symporter, partial [Legionellaceae bacterium]|nr:oligopeptide:H+ symporter [Legionellaceae bacterium]
LAQQNIHSLYPALALICVGAALFKSNPGVLLAQCYQKNSQELHGAFTLYYMAVNIGAIGALLVGPYVSHHFGYGYAYLIAALGILLGLLNYSIQYPVIAHIKTPADQKRISFKKGCGLAVGILLFIGLSTYLLSHTFMARQIILMVTAIFVLFYFGCVFKAKKQERRRLIVAFILMIEAVVFFTLYQQMPTSINVFAVNHIYPELFGIHLDPQSFQVLNPLWIIILSPVIAWVYEELNRRKLFFAIPYKFAVGMIFCSIAFFILYLTRYLANDQGVVSSWWLVMSYFFQAMGELLVSALGIAMVAELVPPKIMGFVIGVWFLTSSVAGFTGAAVASLTALPKGMAPGLDSLGIYTHVFLEIGIATFIAGCMMGLLAPYLTRLMKA